MIGLLVLALFTIAYSMLAKRLANTMVTAPMLFLGFGFFLSTTELMPKAGAEEALHLVAELALIVLLFLDAAQINLKILRQHHVWPLRMLAVGLPLSLVIGTLAAWPFLPGWPLVAVALVAAILTPTDAALGQAVVTNESVPGRARRALSVESGLNDGLALPAILLLASLAISETGQDGTNWAWFGAKQLIFGPLVGCAVGLLGGKILIWAKDHNTTADTYEGIGALALAGAAYMAATAIDGNGFIAAFVAGIAFGHAVKGRCKFVYEFTEGEGQLLTWAAFFLLGLTLMPEALQHLSLPMFGLIMVSLFIVRPLAIYLSLIGTDAQTSTRLFFGWFGPRGLATALFALLVIPRIDTGLAEPVLHIAINAVWISALLHGISAAPGAHFYALVTSRKSPQKNTQNRDQETS
ncbi:sodium:proton antiporter [Pararhizobium sp. IMCC21322]|uniref:cation:proton antiporter n=1 Tax=Pararhizobium sp. IMCC21322 TaxID=3067903 RepID=UPI002740BD54|nr:cation:proton antiporter [Pararhizobium sp. IMCC21322]